MSRFKELRRIETAIKHQDKKELLWALNYCKMRLNLATKIGLNITKMKLHIKHWQKILDKVEDTLDKE